MVEHTSGPWNIDNHPDQIWITDSDNNSAICKVMHMRSEAESDARLIAAAPDLLEALENAKLFANWVECLGRTDCEIYKHELKASADQAIQRIGDAIAKATGEI